MQEIIREFGFDKSLSKISKRLKNLFLLAFVKQIEIVFVCVGTSKVLGDCFGALVGDKLSALRLPFWIFGGTNNNVDAHNLNSTLKVVRLLHPKSFVIVVDSLCTNNQTAIGDIVLSNNYVSINPNAFCKADLFLYATTTYTGHQNLYTKIKIVNKLSCVVSNAIKNAFLSATHKFSLEFLSPFVKQL